MLSGFELYPRWVPLYLLQNFNGVSMLSSYQGDENTGRRYKNHALTYLLVSVPGAKLVSQRS